MSCDTPKNRLALAWTLLCCSARVRLLDKLDGREEGFVLLEHPEHLMPLMCWLWNLRVNQRAGLDFRLNALGP
jgi:hypothetical protein